MLFSTLQVVALCVLLYVSVLFLISLVLKRNDIADVGWGMGIFIVAFVGYLEQLAPSVTASIVLLLVAVWAFRLSVRIFRRNSKKEEDERYRKWRTAWGSWVFFRSYLQVYLLQGVLMICVGYVAVHVSVFGLSTIATPWLVGGVLLWSIGFFFEGVSDYQLDRFLAQPQNSGKLMMSGLWRYSRHPNYFGEVLLWWGIFCIVAPVPYGIYAIISPITITFLILKVSGIPMLERNMSSHPDFEIYKQQTSVFIPLPPKKHV
jgi:steroid 5-alpha reductase family enzyme